MVFEYAEDDFSVSGACSSECAEHKAFFGAQGFYRSREAGYSHKVVERYVKGFRNFGCDVGLGLSAVIDIS